MEDIAETVSPFDQSTHVEVSDIRLPYSEN